MRIIGSGVGALAIAGLIGCAHHDGLRGEYHQAKAEYHHERARGAWERGHPVKAAAEKAKETKDRLTE